LNASSISAFVSYIWMPIFLNIGTCFRLRRLVEVLEVLEASDLFGTKSVRSFLRVLIVHAVE
jgi:hypothetical protein